MSASKLVNGPYFLHDLPLDCGQSLDEVHWIMPIVPLIPFSYPFPGPVQFDHPCIDFVRKQCSLGVDLATHEQEVDGPLEVVETLGIANWALFQLEGTRPRREADGVVEDVAELLVVVAIFEASAFSSFNLPMMRALWKAYRDVAVIEGEREDVVADLGGKTEEWG